MRLWNTVTGACLVEFRGHKGIVNSCAFSHDGAKVISASLDKTARVWNAESGAHLMTLKGHDQWIDWAFFSPDSKRAITIAEDYSIRVWDPDNGREIGRLEGHDSYVEGFGFMEDGKHFITGSQDKTLRAWHLGTCKQVGIFKFKRPLAAMRLRVEGGLVVCGDSEGNVYTVSAALPTLSSMEVAQELKERERIAAELLSQLQG